MEPILLWLVAASMSAFTAWLLKRGSAMTTFNDAIVLLFLLTMMGLMFLSATLYLYFPGFSDLVILIILNMVVMGAFLAPYLLTLLTGNRRLDSLRPGRSVSVLTILTGSAIALVLMSEVFMGWSFEIISGALEPAARTGAVFSAFVGSSSSYWFVLTMAAEMALTYLMMRGRFRGGMGVIVGFQPLMMALSPPAFENRAWADYSFLATAAIMVVVFAYSLRYLKGARGLSRATLGYLICLLTAYAIMMAGLAIWFATGDAAVFVLSVLVQMVAYFYVILQDKRLGAALVSSSADPEQAGPGRS